MGMGWVEANATEHASTIPIVASMKNMPKESKKAKRSTALSKRSHLEVIRINWQHEVNRSSIADFKHSQASITEYTQNRRAATSMIRVAFFK